MARDGPADVGQVVDEVPNPTATKYSVDGASSSTEKIRLEREIIAESGHFDAAFYRAMNPDVVRLDVDPIWHYLTNGAAEGRNPSPNFSTRLYLETHREADADGRNPLLDAIENGFFENRDEKKPGEELRNRINWSERITSKVQRERDLLAESGHFDVSFYYHNNPDVEREAVDPILHYLLVGAAEGRDPSAAFSTRHFATTHPDAVADGGNPLVAAIERGFFDVRSSDDSAWSRRVADIDIVHAHQLLLGRRHEPRDIIDVHVGCERALLVSTLLSSAEFRRRFGDPVQSRSSLPTGLPRRSVAPTLIEWAVAFLSLEPATAAELARPLQWLPVMAIIFHDPTFRRMIATTTPQWAEPDFLVALASAAAPLVWPASLQHDYDLLDSSDQFDCAYYLETYPDVHDAGADPLEHYLRHGVTEGRNPNPSFSTAHYLRDHADVARSGINPLIHYITVGMAEGRKVQAPLTSDSQAALTGPASAKSLDQAYCESTYLQAFQDVAETVADGALGSGLEHYLRVGRSEILAGLRHLPDGFASGDARVLAPRQTELRQEAVGGRRRCQLDFGVDRAGFDEALYRALFPDVPTGIADGKYASGFDHWLDCGYREIASGRRTLNFVDGLPSASGGGQQRIFELQDDEFLMAFPDVLAAATAGRAQLGIQTELHRIEAHQRRVLRFESLLQRPFGINVVGPLGMASGLGSVSRGFLTAIQTAGIDVDVWPYDTADGFRIMPEALTRPPRFRVNLLIVNAEYLPRLFEAYPAGTFDDAYNVAVWHWELCSFRPDYFLSFIDIDEVWTTSRFQLNAIAPLSPVPVHLVPAPVLVRPAYNEPIPLARDIAENAFVFITILDLYSRASRKNPLAVIAAFRQLCADIDGIELILKFHGVERHTEAARELVAAAGACERIHVVDDNLTEREMAALRGRADCLISAHRSEGFGLNIAEFLACGKPVIATKYSGNMDFFDEDVGYPVDYDLVELQSAIPPYPAGYVWAEPRLASLVAQMRRVLGDQEGREARAAAGAKRIAADFSAAAIGAIIAARLAELQIDAAKPRFMEVARRGEHVLCDTPASTRRRRFLGRAHMSFSLLVVVPPSAGPADLEAMLNAVHAQTYGLWELLLRAAPGCGQATLDWLADKCGSSPRIRVQTAALNGTPPKPGLVEAATSRYVAYMQAPAALNVDTLERVTDIMVDKSASDMVFRGTSPAGDGFVAIRKQILLGMALSDLQPAEALSAPFRERIGTVTNLIRELSAADVRCF